VDRFCRFILLPLTPSRGPITHLTHGSGVLANLTILGVALQRLLRQHRLEYLYGCVGADITQAKKYNRAQQAHCHSWEVGWLLLERAANDKQRAFAYGYLTHLAGDVYSHNHFVPTQLIVSFRARALRHIYWEARFDSQQLTNAREIIRDLRRNRFEECDALVESVIARTLFSFRTDKRIFKSFIAVHYLDQWHRHAQLGRTIALRADAAVVQLLRLHRQRRGRVHARRAGRLRAADPTGLEAMTG
jgi:hypothetical protein